MKSKLNVHLTDRAKEAIENGRAVFSQKFKAKGIAAFIVIERKLNPDLSSDKISLSFYNEDKRPLIKDDIIVADGIELVIAVPEALEDVFFGKTVDFKENSFVINV